MDQHRSASYLMESRKAANVVNVCMSADDGANLQSVLAQYLGDTLNLVAGVHYHGFVRHWIAQDGAIALQHSDGHHLMDQFLFHGRQYTSNLCTEGSTPPQRIPVIC
jgi:hypothetical protein